MNSTMNTRFFRSSLLVAIMGSICYLASLASVDKTPILRISTDKDVYESGDPIFIEARIINLSPESIVLQLPPDHTGIRWDLKVSNLERKSGNVYLDFPVGEERKVSLDPTGLIGGIFELTKLIGEQIQQPEEYEISLYYVLEDRGAPDEVSSDKGGASKEKARVFEGELESNIIKISIFDSKDEPCDKDTLKEGFLVYVPKIRTPIEELIGKPTSIDLTTIELGNNRLISEQDIISYDPETHYIEMRDETAKRLLNGPAYAGTFALVCVDRKPIYWAVLTTDICAVGFDWITINMPSPIEPNRRTIRIDLPSRPFVGQDPRNNSEIMEAFRRSGKLKE